jgi:hypothetical protein
MASDSAKVQLAFSDDSGKSFGKAYRLDLGNTIGRISNILVSENIAYTSWIEEGELEASLMLAKTNNSSKTIERTEVSKINSSRNSGFPVLTNKNDTLLIAWTKADSSSRIKTMMIYD